MSDDDKNSDCYRFRDCYGTFLVTRCAVCGKRRVQPLYKNEHISIIECEHKPSVRPVPHEIVLQRIPSSGSLDNFQILNLILRHG